MKIIEKIKEIFKKLRKGLVLGGTVATVGLATACGSDKEADIIDNNVKAEQEIDANQKQNKENDFKQGIKVEESELETIENDIEELKTSEDVLDYIKNMYIEEYEKTTGDIQLSTDDIKITMSVQNYMYQLDDGTIVTHGATPNRTIKSIEEDGHSYNYAGKENMEVYTVRLKETNEIIDAMTVEINEIDELAAKRVIPGDKYNDMKNYTSTLEKLELVIPEGFNYIEQLNVKENQGEMEFVDNQCKVAKNSFIEAIKKVQSKQNDINEKQDEKEIMD